MNRLQAQITHIQTYEGISRILLNYHEQTLSAITLELPSFAQEGREVYVCFKETEVGAAKGSCEHISFSNLFTCTIQSIQQGVILSTIQATHHAQTLTSLITTAAIERLKLEVGDTVIFFVKATELSLEEMV